MTQQKSESNVQTLVHTGEIRKQKKLTDIWPQGGPQLSRILPERLSDGRHSVRKSGILLYDGNARAFC